MTPLVFAACNAVLGNHLDAPADGPDAARTEGGDGGPSPLPDGGQPGTAYASAVTVDAPVAWYRLDDAAGTTSLKNEVRADNPALATGGVTLAVPPLVRGSGAAIALDGVSGSLEIVAGALDFTGVHAFTLEAWIAPKIDASRFARIFSDESDPNTAATWSGYNLSLRADQLYFARIAQGESCGPLIKPAPVTNGRTYHVVAAFDGTTSRLYLDGKLVGDQSCPFANPRTGGPLYVGSEGGLRSQFTGVLDEIAIYDRALPLERVEAHFAAGHLP